MNAPRARFQEFSEQHRLAERSKRYRRLLPFVFFLGGFLFDALTLAGEINAKALMVVCAYALVIPLFFTIRARGIAPKMNRWITLGLHLCLGSLFSALVVLYFRSSGQVFSFLMVVVLFGAMVWNEFARRDDSQRELLWGIYCVSLVMLLNFVLPYVMGSVAAIWFYISVSVGVGLIWALKWAAGVPLKTVRTTTALAAILVVFYSMGWIPPVPLVMESSLVGVEFERANGDYSAMVEEPDAGQRLGVTRQRVHRTKGQAVYVLTAVSAPAGAEIKLEHRWLRRVDGSWQQTDAIPIVMRGGRKDGWRFWTRKRNVVPGLWRVQTAVAGGAVLGHQTFVVRDVGDEEQIVRIKLSL